MKQTDFALHTTSFFTLYLPTRRYLSDATVSSYRDAFKLLLSFAENEKGILADKITLDDFTEPFICDYINWLAEKRGNSSATQKCNAPHLSRVTLRKSGKKVCSRGLRESVMPS